MELKKKIWRIFLIFVGLFFVFFAFRLIYGYLYSYDEERSPRLNQGFSQSASFGGQQLQKTKNNYATLQLNKANSAMPTAIPASRGGANALQQKYDKTSFINSVTDSFEADVKKAYADINELKGLVQSEQNRGVKGQRWLGLVVGVTPENFDALNLKLQEIGKLMSINIEKIDKTNEFLSLQATRTSLEATRKALMDFRSREGKLPELIELQKEILNIESKIQALGVQLSDFDENQSFCTVQYSISERQPEKKYSTPIIARIKTALEWSITYYSLFIAGLFGALLCASLLVLIGVKLKNMLLATESKS